MPYNAYDDLSLPEVGLVDHFELGEEDDIGDSASRRLASSLKAHSSDDEIPSTAPVIAFPRRPLPSVIRDSAPRVGSDSGSSEDYRDHDEEEELYSPPVWVPEPVPVEPLKILPAEGLSALSESSSLPPRRRIKLQLLESKAEEERLRAAYEAEVARGSDLREALELEQEALPQALELEEGLEAQLKKTLQELDDVRQAECWTRMCLEDQLAYCRRALVIQEWEVDNFAKMAAEAKEECERLRRGGPVTDSDIEEALRAADREASELQVDVQRREKAIDSLNLDLQHALEYMIQTNINAAGGPTPYLTSEDFLPSSVRDHLGLGKYGADYLARLLRKFELEMASGACQEPSKHSLGDAFRNSSNAAPGPLPPDPTPLSPHGATNNLPLVAADWEGDWEEDGADPDVWNSPMETDQSTRLPRPASFGSDLGPPSHSLEEEGRLLHEGLAAELQQLTDSLASGPGSAGAKQPLWEVMMAAARGDELAVKAWLPKLGAKGLSRGMGGGDEADFEKLGWTAWHVAAVHGRCGVLECLKEDMVQRATHHRLALGQPTSGTGLPPLGIACLAGEVRSARSLLLGMAPIHARDARGNTPLLWAQMGGRARELVPLLLAAKADPEASNDSGQRADVEMLQQAAASAVASSAASLLTGGSLIDGGTGARPKSRSRDPRNAEPGGPWADHTIEPYHLIRAGGVEPDMNKSFLVSTLRMLKAPVRDSLAFAKNSQAMTQAQLSAEEKALGVWSEWVTNYTHAGLSAAVDAEQAAGDPANQLKSRQAFVLTSERVLLFNAKTSSLVQVIALSEIAEIAFSSYCATVLVLRLHRHADIVIDVAASSRPRLLDELQLAVNHVNSRWGGADFGGGLQLVQECEPIAELLDASRQKAGMLAWVEVNLFLLLPWQPNSLLLAGGDCFCFGLLDLHQQGRDKHSIWKPYFFILKSSPGEGRKLFWCRHPSDEVCAGLAHVRDITAVQPLNTPSGEVCLIVDYKSGDRAELLTLRANSVQNREDWIVSIRTMQTGL